MFQSNHQTDATRRRLGGASALLASAAFIAACSSAGAGATNPPAATTAPGTAASSALVLTLATSPTLGGYVAGMNGLAVYIFEKDTGTTTACTGACVTTWPAVTVANASDVTARAGVTGNVGTAARADGTLQVTLGGHLLYYYSGDSAAGDTNGQGTNNVWFVSSAAGDPVGMATSSQAPAASPSSSKCSGYCY